MTLMAIVPVLGRGKGRLTVELTVAIKVINHYGDEVMTVRTL